MGKLAFACLVVIGGLTNLSQAEAAIERLELNYTDSCDGLNLWIFDAGFVFGQHTGCGGGEYVIGSTFTTSNSEDGLTIYYFDTQSYRLLRTEILETGFRANKYYVYEFFSGILQHYGPWAPVVE